MLPCSTTLLRMSARRLTSEDSKELKSLIQVKFEESEIAITTIASTRDGPFGYVPSLNRQLCRNRCILCHCSTDTLRAQGGSSEHF